MAEEKNYIDQHKHEISLKDLILKIKVWWRYLISKWILIVVAFLIGAGLGLTYAIMQKMKYVGELTFVLEDSRSSPLSAYAGLASQFGIDLSGGGSSGVFEGDNIMGFLKSRLMIETTLLSPVELNGERRTLADLYIEFNELNSKWEDNPLLKTIHFPPNLARAKFSLQQDSILNILQKRVTEKNLEIEKPDKKLNFISVKCTSLNEMFSKIFTERLVKEATDFYVNTKIKRSKVNVDRLQQAADSMELLLNHKTYSLAVTKDVNLNPAKQVAGVRAEVEARDKLVLQTMYGEIVKNLELSKMAMEQEMPVVQIIDTPILPLDKKKLSKPLGIILGGFLGGFFIGSFLIGKRIYREMLEN